MTKPSYHETLSQPAEPQNEQPIPGINENTANLPEDPLPVHQPAPPLPHPQTAQPLPAA